MAFSDSVKDDAFKRSGGRCECTRSSHTNHTGRCTTSITRHGAEYHHVDSGGSDALGNCEALCTTCHQQTGSYGGC